MPRSIKTMKLCAAALGVAAVAAVPGGVAFAQSPSGPSLHSTYSGSGAGAQSGPNGPVVPSTGSAPPMATPGSITSSFARTIVAAHDGQLALHALADGGLRVTVTLPSALEQPTTGRVSA